MVLKRSVCGLNTGERVSRRCVNLICRQLETRGLKCGLVCKSIEQPIAAERTIEKAKADWQSDRVRILADATGTDLQTCRSQFVSGSSKRSRDALDFSDGGLEVRGDLLWHRSKRRGDGWVANRDVSAGASQYYSLNKRRRWELFDRLYDAIENLKSVRRTGTPRIHHEVHCTGRKKAMKRSQKAGVENNNFQKSSPFLPFRVRALVLRPRAKDQYFLRFYRNVINTNVNVKGTPTAVAYLDSHAQHCTAVRVARERSFAESTHLEQCALRRTHRSRTEAKGLVALSEGSEAEVSRGRAVVMGTERPDMNDDRQVNSKHEGESLYEQRKRARAVHHNQHFRGVQRPARWKAEAQRSLIGYRTECLMCSLE